MRTGEPKRGDLPSEKLTSQLVTRLNSVTIEEIIEQGMHAFIDQFQGAINSLGNIVYADFFKTVNQTKRFVGQRQVRQRQTIGGLVQQQG